MATVGFKKHRRTCILAILGWLAFIGLFVQESRSLARGFISPLTNEGKTKQREATLRVVSLNCAGGNPDAAEEVLQYEADIVLLQEVPTHRDVQVLAQRLFQDDASLAWDPDTAIIARGSIEQASLAPPIAMFMTQAHIRLRSGLETEVISLRLLPPTAEMNLFSPSCWKEHQRDRQLRRTQLLEMMAQLAPVPKDIPVIVGGDFNVPARDGTLRILGPSLRDAFQQGGIGWGNTAINSLPLWRVDQIWVSNHFSPVAVFAKKTKHSDHRMVICDLVLTPRMNAPDLPMK